MRRVHLFEMHDFPGFPPVWRDLLTDFLSFFAATFRPYAGVAPVLADALKKAGTHKIVDLCSGAGRPIVSLAPDLRAMGLPNVEIVLTDKYPHIGAWADLGRGVTFEAEPVDAVDVPGGLDGFRTLFTSFHHLAPKEARAVLSAAAEKEQGIGIFDYTERSIRWVIPVCLIPLFVWVCTPFIRPFSWRRLVWTYLVPAIPIVAAWDGFVSCLRTYSPDDLRDLVEGLENSGYRWDIGRMKSVGISRVTYAIGVPSRRAEDRSESPQAQLNVSARTGPVS